MLKKISLAIVFAAAAVTASAQEKKVTVADFVGTWNIEMMSHQIALVVEPAEGAKVNATLMLMGRDTPLKGEFADRSITLSALKQEGEAGGPGVHAAPAGSGAKPLVITMQDDGTIAGEMMTQQGPVKFTGEKLKAKKKG
jgi:hypothetical protein